jgi:hypothetical protein
MKKHKKIIIALIVIVLIVCIAAFFIIKNRKTNFAGEMQEGMRQFSKEDFDVNNIDFSQISTDETSAKEIANKTDKKSQNATTTLKTTAEVESALTENVELHATYYLEEVYVEENEFVAKGENILKYTNGTYLVAPYDCYIIKLNVPDVDDKVLNSHYVEISSSNSLMVTMKIDETNISKLSVGQEATIEVSALGKTYTGNITHIASTGSNGKFEIEIEFENDSNVKIGMSGDVSITIK